MGRTELFFCFIFLSINYFLIFEFILFIFLYSRFLLDIYFTHINVCMSIPISQFITHPPNHLQLTAISSLHLFRPKMLVQSLIPLSLLNPTSNPLGHPINSTFKIYSESNHFLPLSAIKRITAIVSYRPLHFI